MKIQSDKIVGPEKDILGRFSLANEIVKGLNSYSKFKKDGFTISITGEWGSGKSNLLEFIKIRLTTQNEVEYKIIEFNPWMFTTDESIKEIFLTQLALELKDFEAKSAKLGKSINEFIKAFKWVKYFNSVAGNVQQGFENFTEQLSENFTIKETKEAVEKALLKQKKKIIVLIDDIDRLESNQITELFQTISLVTNFSNIIYLISFDRNIVINSLQNSFGNRAHEYLEKIIQVEYELPPLLDEKIEDVFLSSTTQISKRYNLEIDQEALNSIWNYHGLKEYFKTLRDFKRYFNGLIFRLESIKDEVNILDFLVIEAVRIFDYESYKEFYLLYKSNIRKRNISEEGLSANQYDLFKPASAEILKCLFNSRRIPYDINSKRLKDPAFFERYFSLLKNTSDISEKEFKEFITRGNSRVNILQDSIKFNRIENLLSRLSDVSIADHYTQNDFLLINSIISVFNQNENLFQKYAYEVSNAIINLICSHKEQTKMIRSFFERFKDSEAGSNVVLIYFFHYIRLYKRTGEVFNTYWRVFDDYYKKNYDALLKSYHQTFKRAESKILGNIFTRESPYIKLLYQINYAELFPQDYSNFLAKLFDDNDYLLYLAGYFIEIDEKTLEFRKLNNYYLHQLFPDQTFIKFIEKVKSIPDHNIEDRQKVIIRYLTNLDLNNVFK